MSSYAEALQKNSSLFLYAKRPFHAKSATVSLLPVSLLIRMLRTAPLQALGPRVLPVNCSDLLHGRIAALIAASPVEPGWWRSLGGQCSNQ